MKQENHGRCWGLLSGNPTQSSRKGRPEAAGAALRVTFLQEAAKCADGSSGHNPDIPFQWTVFHQMNHREPPHPTAAMRRALLRLSLLLSTAGALSSAHAIPRRPVIVFTERTVAATPYLPYNGAPPLRFAAAPAPLKLLEAPVAAATTPASSAEAPASSSTSAATPTDGTTSAALTEALTEGATASSRNPAPATKSPAPILPDEARPTVRAEDFLPFFQIPASSRKPGDVTLLVPGIPTPPAPGTLQPSSATYTQSPK
jgi:hypothetical protein